MASAGASSGGLVGRCQGMRWRRVSRAIEAIFFGLLFINPDALRNQSFGSKVQAVAITVVIIAVVDAWFSRRMGLTVNERGITLHYAYFRKSLPWAKIEGFDWRRWRRPQSESLWIRVAGGRPVRIPTLQRATGGHTGSFLGSVLTSESLRLKGGAEVDAMATLQSARAAMQREPGSHQPSSGAGAPTCTVRPQ